MKGASCNIAIQYRNSSTEQTNFIVLLFLFIEVNYFIYYKWGGGGGGGVSCEGGGGKTRGGYDPSVFYGV